MEAASRGALPAFISPAVVIMPAVLALLQVFRFYDGPDPAKPPPVTNSGNREFMKKREASRPQLRLILRTAVFPRFLVSLGPEVLLTTKLNLRYYFHTERVG